MNPFERAIRTVDAWQQRHRGPAAFAVIKKSGDDQGGNLFAPCPRPADHAGVAAGFPRRR